METKTTTEDTQIITRTPDTKDGNNNQYSYLHNLSGRFWISLVFAVGFVGLGVQILLNITDANQNSYVNIFNNFGTAAGMVIGTYMGQNNKNTTNGSGSVTTVTTK